MQMLENLEISIKEGEAAVKEAEMGIRILKEADEPTKKMEADLKVVKDKLTKLRKAFLKETKKE